MLSAMPFTGKDYQTPPKNISPEVLVTSDGLGPSNQY